MSLNVSNWFVYIKYIDRVLFGVGTVFVGALQNCDKWLLALLCLFFVCLSVCLSILMEQLGSHSDLIFEYFLKIFWENLKFN